MLCKAINLLMTFAFLLLLGGFAIAETRTFELQHRPADEAAVMLRQLLGADAKIAAHDNVLMVNVPSSDMAGVEALLSSYDRAQKMLKVTVEQGRVVNVDSSSVSTSGRITLGPLSFGLGGSNRGGQGSLHVGSSDGHARVSAEDSFRQEGRKTKQFVSVLEGEPAKVSVGRSVPFTGEMCAYYSRHPQYVEPVEYKDVDTGFEVLPEISGDTVRLQIRPFMAFLDPRNQEQIVFHELTSKVAVPFGTWYDIGGHMSKKDGLSREILGMGNTSGSDSSTLRLRVDEQ